MSHVKDNAVTLISKKIDLYCSSTFLRTLSRFGIILLETQMSEILDKVITLVYLMLLAIVF